MTRTRPSTPNDSGASMIIALMFVTGVGLVVTALLTYGMTGITSAGFTGQAAQSSADAGGAMQTAINDVRNSTYNNGGTACLATGDRRIYPSLVTGGKDTTVTCSPDAATGLGGGLIGAPITPENRPPSAVLTLGDYGGGALPGTLPDAPSDIVVTPNAGKQGSAVIISGSNIAGATVIQIGTAAEIQTATGATLSPCVGGVPAAGCFTTSGATLAISSMPAHVIGPVQVQVITLGTASSGAFTYQVIPSAPATPTAAAGPASATVTWSAPADGGSPITGYVITPYRAGIAQPPVNVAASPTSATLTGLTVGQSYRFTVAAVNLVGTGPASAQSNAVVPFASAPGAPTIGAATAGTLGATLSWAAPASDGGSALTGYVVTPYRNGTIQPTQTFPATPTTQRVINLTAGASYTFTVRAVNAVGTGPPSAASNAVTINAAIVLTFPNPMPAGRLFTIYDEELTATGGTGPFAWSISAGSIPEGLTLNASTGVISGSPQWASFGANAFTVRLTDSFGATATKATGITIGWWGPTPVDGAVPADLGDVATFDTPPDGDRGSQPKEPGPGDMPPPQQPAAFRDDQPRRLDRRMRRPSSGSPRPRRRSAGTGSSTGGSGRGRLVAMIAACGLAASTLIGATPGTAFAAGLQLFDQPFHNNTADGSGAVVLPTTPGATNFACLTASGNPGPSALRSCTTTLDAPGSGKLRLTDAATNRSGAAFGAVSVPTAQGLDITFDAYQYGGGSSADGLTLVLAATDPAAPAAPASVGQLGGSLGYTPYGTGAGVPYGYLGFGFDVYGNFSSPSFQGSGCTNPSYFTAAHPGQVVVRGPGNGTVGYCGLNSTAAGGGANPPVVPLKASTRLASQVPVEAVINPSTSSVTTTSGLTVAAESYMIVFTPVGQAQRTLSGPLPVVAAGLYPASWLDADGYPKQLAFGWVGTTGGSTDFHEVDDTHVASLTGAAVPSLTVAQTAYTYATLVAGDPVSYEVVVGVQPGPDETYAITVTDEMPPGVVPVAGSGTGWVCLPPSGQVMTCTNSTVPFLAGSALPTLTITGIVTASGVTPSVVRSDSVVSAFSADAIAVTGGETGWLNTGDAPVRVLGPVYSNSTIVSEGGSGVSCAATWPLPDGTSGCNGIYVDESVTTESSCTGSIVTPGSATKNCATGVHTPAGDDPAISAPASYAQPTDNVVPQPLPACSAGSSIVTFTPGYYDNAAGLSALTGGAAACRYKTFWFQPGRYYFDFHNSEMPTSGTPVIPNGPDVWTFNDATSVIVGGEKKGWTTSGVTAAALPGACVSPLASATAKGVQFVFADDSRLHQEAGSIELCGTYSASKPPIVLSGSTGAGGAGTTPAVLRPSALSSSSKPANNIRYTTSVPAIVSETDGIGPTVTNLPAGRAATLHAASFSGLSPVAARSVLDSAVVTIRHRDRNVAVGATLEMTITPTRTGAAALTRDLPLTYASTTSPFEIDEVDLLSDLQAEIYAYGLTGFTLDVVLTTPASTPLQATQIIDYLKIDLAWRPIAVRAQSGCVTLSAGCSVMLTSSDGGLDNELYFQGTVHVPKAMVTVANRVADGPVFADGIIARAFVLQSDAFSGGQVYDGNLIQIPDLRTEATPLMVYLTAWTCTTSTACAQPPSPAVGSGWKVVGRTMVQYVDLPAGVIAGQRDVSIKTWQLPR